MAAVVAAFTLRKHGFNGQIIILEQSALPPYDRSGVSRDLSAFDVARSLLKPLDWYCRLKITLQLEAEVSSVNFDEQKIQLKSTAIVNYDRLIICSGCRPRKLLQRPNVLESEKSERVPVQGHSLRNIFQLHNASDTKSLRGGTCTGKRVVVIGSGLTAFEFVSWLGDRAAFLGLVCNTQTPLESVMGRGITPTIQAELRRRSDKITCYLMHDVLRFESATSEDVAKMSKDQQAAVKDRVAYVVLRKYQKVKRIASIKVPPETEEQKAVATGPTDMPSDAPDLANDFVDDVNNMNDEDDDEQQTIIRYEGAEMKIPCDIAVVAVGVEPNTSFLKPLKDVNKVDEKLVLLNSRGYIPTDQYMRTNLVNVYACGDCSAPLVPRMGRQLLESSTNYAFAGATARTAALNAGASIVAQAASSSAAKVNDESEQPPASELHACSLYSTNIFGHEFHFAGDLQDDAVPEDADDGEDETRNEMSVVDAGAAAKHQQKIQESTKENFRTLVHGAMEENSFAMYYFVKTVVTNVGSNGRHRGGRCLGVLVENFPPAHVVFAELRANGFNVYYEQLRPHHLVNPNLPKLARTYLCNALLDSYFQQHAAFDGYGVAVPQDLLILAGAKSNKVRVLQQQAKRTDESQQNLTVMGGGGGGAKLNIEKFKKKKTTGLFNFMPINASLTKILEQNECYSLK